MIDDDDKYFKIEKEDAYAFAIIVGCIFAFIGAVGGWVSLFTIPTLRDRVTALEGGK